MGRNATSTARACRAVLCDDPDGPPGTHPVQRVYLRPGRTTAAGIARRL